MGDDNGSAGLSARAEERGAERPAQERGMEEDRTETHFRRRDDLPDFHDLSLLHTLSGHADAVAAARFSKDGARLASASADATIKIWDVRTGSLLHTLQHKRASGNAHSYARTASMSLQQDAELLTPAVLLLPPPPPFAAGLLRCGVEPGHAPPSHRQRRRRHPLVGLVDWEGSAAAERAHSLCHLGVLLHVRHPPGQLLL